MKRVLSFPLFLFPLIVMAQEMLTPSEKTNFNSISTYTEIEAFVRQLDDGSPLVETEIIGQSAGQRNLFALKFSEQGFGKDTGKIKVLFFAQQHGNEQSGKEGVLLLAADLLKPEYRYLFERIDLALIPQVNPDGSEKNTRRNGRDMDLNRNHLILTEPETRALHAYFDKHLFHATMDIHEYSPYGEEWKKTGYRKNSRVTLGATTNVNVAKAIRNFSNNRAVPFVLDYLDQHGYSSFVYCPGGPPGVDYIRHSTFDINDGRQSLGILNTFSFIQEGMNGEDTYLDNLKVRAESQEAGMLGMLEFIYQNSRKIKKLVEKERQDLINAKPGKPVSIQAEHVPDGSTLNLPLFSYATGKDTIVQVKDYRPVVESIYSVKRPLGYLVPKNNPELTGWLGRQSITFKDYKPSGDHRIERYFVQALDSIDFERDIIVNPTLVAENILLANPENYVFVPVQQLKGNLLIQALEPKSMLSFYTYPLFAQLLVINKQFPVLRVTR